MNSFNNNNNNIACGSQAIDQLTATLRVLEELQVPHGTWSLSEFSAATRRWEDIPLSDEDRDSEGRMPSESFDGHWGGTLQAMKAFIGLGGAERLPDSWVTALSVTRAYGPTPTLAEAERKLCLEALFPAEPAGVPINPSGAFYEWGEAADRLLEGCT